MPTERQPWVNLSHLDQLWFQVTGTLCNLACDHCFIRCSPHNRLFGFLSLDTICDVLDKSVSLGVKEYYFTGGEPFLHPDLTQMLVRTLDYGPASVLTNGTVLKDEWLTRLAEAERNGCYSLEFRVSLDGYSPETNDPIRGHGTFARAMHGIRKLVRHGFLPIITIARTWEYSQERKVVSAFTRMLEQAGYGRPRLKILPTLRLGAEEERVRGYDPTERVTAEMLTDFDQTQLLCHHSRIVTNRGVHVCPILIESRDSVLGATLTEAARPFAIRHGACFTCFQYGSICANPSSNAWQEG
ncbi:MAG: radical SAM protein [Planctomycetales bacterium]|nr:radical SAM protein [Planctomycetales bacterium]